MQSPPTAQRTAIQSLVSLLPSRVKSSASADYFLKYGSAVLLAAGAKRLLYDDEKTIVSKILIALGKVADQAEIRANQEECRSLFTPEQRLNYGPTQLILYPLIRMLRPEVVVETGCAWGGSSAFLLAALHKNAHGRLVSIDLPASETVQTKEMGIRKSDIGALIPPTLRSRWNLIVGDARSCLPKLLAETDADIFYHDSLHTTTHQAFEYETARSLMRNNTVIASDDIRLNDSFPNFLKLHKLRGYAPLRQPNFGITLNQFDPYEIECGLFR